MMDPQGGEGDIKAESKACPSCHRENDLAFTACWKCGTVFLEGPVEKKPGSLRSMVPPETFVVGIVVCIILIVLFMNLPKLPSRGPKADETDVEPKTFTKKSLSANSNVAVSEKLANKLKAPDGMVRTDAGQAAGDTGGYHFLVTSLPNVLVSKKSRTAYFEGLMESYLHSHAGSTLSEKKELMLRDQYPAVEYKIGFRDPKNGSMKPFTHHAMTTVIANKAYTVSKDYPQDLNEDGSAMRENLIDSLLVVQKADSQPS